MQEPMQDQEFIPVSAFEDDDDRALAAMLSSVPVEPETETVFVKSIAAPIVIRGLTEAEIDDWTKRFRPRKDGSIGTTGKERTIIEAHAHLVAMALVKPQFTMEQLMGQGVTTIADLLRKRLKPLEITAISDKVMDLSGGGEDAVEVGKG